MPAGVQWIVLVTLSAALAALLLWLHAPAALMLGPLLAAIAFSACNGKVAVPLAPFVVAQGVVGVMIGKMVPLSILGDIANHWLLFGVGVLAVIAISTFIGWLMTRLQLLPGTTALWGTSPGAASVMTIMSESYGADMRLVAFMQYLRIVLVAGIAALVARLFGVTPQHHVAAEMVWFPPVNWLAFAGTMALAVLGPQLARWINMPAGAFLVPMVGAILLSHFGLMTIELPPWFLAACYAFIGWNVGLRFTRGLLVHALRLLPQIMACVLAMIALCGLVAALLVVGTGIDPLTAYLATSPGGSDSIAIITASTDADVSFVMAMQTVRLVAVLFLGPLLTRYVVMHINPVPRKPPK